MTHPTLMKNVNEFVRCLPICVVRKKINALLDGKVSKSCQIKHLSMNSARSALVVASTLRRKRPGFRATRFELISVSSVVRGSAHNNLIKSRFGPAPISTKIKIKMSSAVRCYFLTPAADVPNSTLPVLHYQNVLPQPWTEDTTTEFLTSHGWVKRVRFNECLLLVSLITFDF